MQLELNCYYNSMYKRFNATVTSALSLRVCARTRSKPVSGPYFLICASLFGSRNVVHTTWHYLFLRIYKAPHRLEMTCQPLTSGGSAGAHLVNHRERSATVCKAPSRYTPPGSFSYRYVQQKIGVLVTALITIALQGRQRHQLSALSFYLDSGCGVRGGVLPYLLRVSIEL